MKPWVKKYGSYWAWRCPHAMCTRTVLDARTGFLLFETPGEEFGERTRDPWCVALTRALQHADQFHGEVG